MEIRASFVARYLVPLAAIGSYPFQLHGRLEDPLDSSSSRHPRRCPSFVKLSKVRSTWLGPHTSQRFSLRRVHRSFANFNVWLAVQLGYADRFSCSAKRWRERIKTSGCRAFVERTRSPPNRVLVERCRAKFPHSELSNRSGDFQWR